MRNHSAVLRLVALVAIWGLSFLPHYLAPGAPWVRPAETTGSLLLLVFIAFAIRDQDRKGPYADDRSALKLK